LGGLRPLNPKVPLETALPETRAVIDRLDLLRGWIQQHEPTGET
jgi:hypothetical protein